MLGIKSSGGHATYALARLLKLNEPETFKFEGRLSSRVVHGVRTGIIRQMVCRGAGARVPDHFDALCQAVRAPTCMLSNFVLNNCTFPADRKFADLLEALAHLGGRLKSISMVNTNLTGHTIPESFFERCTELTEVYFNLTGLVGRIPESVGRLTKLRHIYLWGNEMQGPVPLSLGNCTELLSVYLIQGPPPAGNRRLALPPAVKEKLTRLRNFL